MLIAAIADLHGFLPKTPECDVLVIAGDVCPLEDHSRKFQLKWLRGPFSEWLDEQPAKRKIGVAGNHDIVTADALGLAPTLPWTYLLNSAVEIDGVLFWGSPMSPTFGVGWAWMNDEPLLAPLWEKIPEKTDVLITHGPPLGARDRTYNPWGYEHGVPVGSSTLRERVLQVRPLLHLCGHIHPGYGVEGILHSGGTTVVGNASIVNGLYEHVNNPLLFRLTKATGYVQSLM